MRIVTFNVHGCVGMDFHRSEARIAERIARLEPDIVALQELDVGRRRSSGCHQAEFIARHLNFESHFHPSMRWAEEQYGNAVLSRWPIRLRRAGELPSENAFLFRESRAAHWAEIDAPGGPLHVINTHLGVGRLERREQATALAGAEWIGAIPVNEPALLLGDLNSMPGSTPHALLEREFRDLVKSFSGGHQRTFPAMWPVVTLDHVFGNARIRVVGVDISGEWSDAVVSDHLPVVVDFEIIEAAASPAAT